MRIRLSAVSHVGGFARLHHVAVGNLACIPPPKSTARRKHAPRTDGGEKGKVAGSRSLSGSRARRSRKWCTLFGYDTRGACVAVRTLVRGHGRVLRFHVQRLSRLPVLRVLLFPSGTVVAVTLVEELISRCRVVATPGADSCREI